MEENENTLEIKGKVEDVINKTTKTGKAFYQIQIKDELYGGFGECPAKKGDEVILEYVKNDKYNNIKAVKDKAGKPLKKKETEHTEPNKEARRMWAISEATKIFCTFQTPEKLEWDKAKKEILKMAKELEDEAKK